MINKKENEYFVHFLWEKMPRWINKSAIKTIGDERIEIIKTHKACHPNGRIYNVELIKKKENEYFVHFLWEKTLRWINKSDVAG